MSLSSQSPAQITQASFRRVSDGNSNQTITVDTPIKQPRIIEHQKISMSDKVTIARKVANPNIETSTEEEINLSNSCNNDDDLISANSSMQGKLFDLCI